MYSKIHIWNLAQEKVVMQNIDNRDVLLHVKYIAKQPFWRIVNVLFYFQKTAIKSYNLVAVMWQVWLGFISHHAVCFCSLFVVILLAHLLTHTFNPNSIPNKPPAAKLLLSHLKYEISHIYLCRLKIMNHGVNARPVCTCWTRFSYWICDIYMICFYYHFAKKQCSLICSLCWWKKKRLILVI